MKTEQIVQHLTLLRKLLLQSLLIIAILFLVLFSFSHQLYQFVALPLLSILPVNSHLIATTVTAPLIVPIKLSLYGSLFIATPFILLLCWRFITPALYQQEKRFVWSSLFITFLLFYSGILFCYFLVLPLIFRFLLSMVPSYIQLLPDMGHYLSFCLKLLFAFGLAFETPLLVVMLAVCRVASLAKMRQWRPYVVIAAFVLGMLLTPPDVISQICLAIPLWLLYEVGLLCSKLLLNGRNMQQDTHHE